MFWQNNIPDADCLTEFSSIEINSSVFALLRKIRYNEMIGHLTVGALKCPAYLSMCGMDRLFTCH